MPRSRNRTGPGLCLAQNWTIRTPLPRRSNDEVSANIRRSAHASERLLREAVASLQAGYPRAVQVEFDAVPPAGVGESRIVAIGQCREFLEPALAPGGRQDLDDPRRLVCRIPHGMLDVSGLERPLAGASGAHFIPDQD